MGVRQFPTGKEHRDPDMRSKHALRLPGVSFCNRDMQCVILRLGDAMNDPSRASFQPESVAWLLVSSQVQFPRFVPGP